MDKQATEYSADKAWKLANGGRFAEAISIMEKVALHQPTAEHIYELARICHQADLLTAALNYYKQVLTLDPQKLEAWKYLVLLLREHGQVDEALAYLIKANELNPQSSEVFSSIKDFCQAVNPKSATPELLNLVTSIMEIGSGAPQSLSPFLSSAVLHHVSDVKSYALRTDLMEIANNRPLLALLNNCIIQSVDLEDLVVNVRKRLLFKNGMSNPLFSEDLLRLTMAIANQCLSTEYVFSQSDQESCLIAEIVDRLPQEHDASRLLQEALLVACYTPLAKIPIDIQDVGQPFEALDSFFERHIEHPKAEAKIASEIESLTEILDPTSSLVKQQYEHSPYPRWINRAPLSARPFCEELSHQVPFIPVSHLPAADKMPEILIAGCGTGQHAIQVAQMFPESPVTAVDLSRVSLAYACRKSREAELNNIKYFHADILELDPSEKQYDVIESVGVLHHMQDPLKGWQKLISMLRPGGYLKIGLYSRRAREQITEARNIAAAVNGDTIQEKIRNFRKHIRQSADVSHEVKETLLPALDFYSRGGCHDLVFNVQEACFTLPELDRFICLNPLTFLGFQQSSHHILKLYAEKFPDDPHQLSLSNWHNLEKEYSGLFSSMYTFWLVKDR